MSLLAPFFLLGALAIALPVVFHLVRRATRERTLFSSLMFLRAAPPRLTQRNRLEHLLLLVLRCAVIGLLALGFARPFLKRLLPPGPAGGPARRLAVLVDTSASMQRGGLWAEARAKAISHLRAAAPGDQVALFTFDRQLSPLLTFEQWNATPAADRGTVAERRLAAAKPGWAATHLDQALIRTAELLAEAPKAAVDGPRQIVLISDLQSGSRLSSLQGHEWPKGVDLLVESLRPRPASNAGLQWVTDTAGAAREAEPTVRVRVSNEPDSTQEQFQVGWAREGGGFLSNATEIYVPAGQSRVVALPLPPTEARADRIGLRGDDEDFDNTIFIVPPEVARLNVLYLGNETATDPKQPLYFLRRAFQETRRQTVQVIAQSPAAPISAGILDSAALIVVTDPVDAALARTLQAHVNQGKTLLAAPKSAEAARALSGLLGVENLAITESSPSRYALLAEIDFRHPLFAPFADARFSDFSKIHFWKLRRLDAEAIPNARVLAKFDSGDPALLEVPVGRGRVLVLSSGWQPADSQLALSSKFVPLLYAMLELSGLAEAPPSQYVVGNPVALPADLLRTNSLLRRPDMSTLTLSAGETNFTQTLLPGVYQIGGGTGALRFAVNLDPAESRTAPLAADELDRLGAPIARATRPMATTAQKIQMQNAELEGRQKLWRWLVVAVLVVLLVETWLAGRTARRLVPDGGVA